MHIFISKKYLSYKNYKVKCSVGKRGIGRKKKEGDLITPIGSFRIKKILFRKDRVKNLKTKIIKIPIKRDMVWCDNPNSSQYNKLIRSSNEIKSERLFRSDNIYDIIFVLDYNMSPIRKNKGSAIFVHIAKRKFTPTKGCVAIQKREIKKLLKFIDKKTIVKIF